MQIIETLKKKYRHLLRININKRNQERLTNKDVSIISSNCTGGVIAHELNIGFSSPTVNLFISPSDFVKFCQQLKYYLSIDPEFVEQKEFTYPVARIDDILIHCVHYNSFDEFKIKWNERKKRCNFDNMVFIMSERDGCSYEDIVAFDQLSYRNKVVFVSKEMPEIKSSIYIPHTENTNDENQALKILTGYQSIFSGKRLIDQFDYVSFLNSGIIRLSHN